MKNDNLNQNDTNNYSDIDLKSLTEEEYMEVAARAMGYSSYAAVLQADKEDEKRMWKKHPIRMAFRSFKKLPFLLRALIFIILLVVVFSIVGNIAYKIRVHKAMQESGMTLDLMGVQVPSEKEYLDKLKKTASDIAGKSQYDKKEMGLNVEDGSDTDMDGLTDKEEIEVYGSDPLLASTAGDLYLDGYKVEHDMDLFKTYEYRKEITFDNNECKEVGLTADIPSDLNAVVKDYTKKYDLSGFGIDQAYAGYWMYNYNGTVILDMEENFKKNHITDKDIQILIAKGSFIEEGLTEFKNCKFKSTGAVLTLEYEFNKDDQYYIYVVEKNSVTEKIKKTVDGTINTAVEGVFGENVSKTTGQAVIHGSLFWYWITKKGLTIEYVELGSEEETDAFLEQALKHYGGGNFIAGTYQDIKESKNEILKPVSQAEFDKKYKFYSKALSWFEIDDSGDKTKEEGINLIIKGIWCFSPFICDISDLVVNDEESDETSDFNKLVDELPFSNFGSYINQDGNCAGISHLTAYLYNTKSLPTNGKYTISIDGKDKDITWNLTEDKENATLMDPGLADYKDDSFVKNHSSKGTLLDTGLDSGEEQFVNMIGCFWAEGNHANDYSQYVKTDGNKNSYDIIKKAKKYIDKGKVLDVYLGFYGLSGHAVNIYDYKVISKDEIWFVVYDNNIPQDNAFLEDDACYLKVKKIIQDDGTAAFEYLYWPLGKNSPRYLATSYNGLMPTSMIVMMDENWNVIQ